MKLPDAIQGRTPQPKLEDVKRGWRVGNLIQDIGNKTAGAIKAYNRQQAVIADSEADLASADYKAELAVLAEKIKSTNTVPLDDLPDSLRTEYISENNIDGSIDTSTVLVPMEKVGARLFDYQSDKLADDYPESRTNSRFITGVAQARKEYAPQVIKRIYQLGNERIKENGNAVIQAHVDSLNEIAAKNKNDELYSVGAITPKEYSEGVSDIESSIDQGLLLLQLQNANTLEDLENIDEQIEYGLLDFDVDGNAVTRELRLNTDAQNNLYKQVEAKRKRVEAATKRVHNDNFNDGVQLLTNGQLNKQWIDDKLERNLIAPEKANTLLNAMNNVSNSPLVTNPALKSKLTGDIAGIRFASGSGVTVSGQAEILRNNLRVRNRGFYDDGTVYDGQRLSGKDFNELLNLVDTTLKNSTRNQGYKEALDLIKAQYKFDPLTNTFIDAGAAKAYEFGKQELQAYMDENGIEAKPIEFVNNNLQRFDANLFTDDNQSRFLKLYPQYKGNMYSGVIERAGGKKEKYFDEKRIMANVFTQLQSGEIDFAEADKIVSDLKGRSVPLSNDQLDFENANAFYEYINDEY